MIRWLGGKSPTLWAGIAILTCVFAGAWLLPILSQDPLASDFVGGRATSGLPVGPCSAHLLGTDRIFRDVASRILVAVRLSLVISIAATVVATTLGTLVGIVSGYYESSAGSRILSTTLGLVSLVVFFLLWGPGATVVAACAIVAILVARSSKGSRTHGPLRVLISAIPPLNADDLLMRMVDAGLAFPFLILVLALGAVLDNTSPLTIGLILGVTGWLGTARVIRAKTMQLRTEDYVQAARALGSSTPAIAIRHLLPNLAGLVLVTLSTSVASMVLAESALSFLGAGVSPPTPTLGRMLHEGQDYFDAAPWLVAAPVVALFAIVTGFNLLGEGLRATLSK